MKRELRFIADMSHEMKTPLTSIIALSDAILQGMMGEVNEEVRKAVEIINRNARHLLKLATDVMDISRIELGEVKAEEVECDLEELIEEAIGTIAPMAEGSTPALASARLAASTEMLLDQVLAPGPTRHRTAGTAGLLAVRSGHLRRHVRVARHTCRPARAPCPTWEPAPSSSVPLSIAVYSTKPRGPVETARCPGT